MSDPIFHNGTPTPVCPWCGHRDEFDYEYHKDGSTQNCPMCKKPYELEVEFSPECYTTKAFNTRYAPYGLIATGSFDVPLYTKRCSHIHWLAFARSHWQSTSTSGRFQAYYIAFKGYVFPWGIPRSEAICFGIKEGV